MIIRLNLAKWYHGINSSKKRKIVFFLNLSKRINLKFIRKLEYWSTDAANLINGTDFTIFPPFRTRSQILYAFNSEFCRSVRLTYLRDNEINGIKTYDFHISKDIFFNSSLNPENMGFCDSDCLGNGIFNISKCRAGNFSVELEFIQLIS